MTTAIALQAQGISSILSAFSITANLLMLAALHLGLSIGWNIGTGIRKAYEKNGSYRTKALTLVYGSFQHYTLGMAIIVIALTFILGFANYTLLCSIALLGVGVGMAYSDREDDPPEGMTRHILKRIRKTGDRATEGDRRSGGGRKSESDREGK